MQIQARIPLSHQHLKAPPLHPPPAPFTCPTRANRNFGVTATGFQHIAEQAVISWSEKSTNGTRNNSSQSQFWGRVRLRSADASWPTSDKVLLPRPMPSTKKWWQHTILFQINAQLPSILGKELLRAMSSNSGVQLVAHRRKDQQTSWNAALPQGSAHSTNSHMCPTTCMMQCFLRLDKNAHGSQRHFPRVLKVNIAEAL